MTKPLTIQGPKAAIGQGPCLAYARGMPCKDGRDHCFNCGRHMDPETAACPKGCGEGDDDFDDAANN